MYYMAWNREHNKTNFFNLNRNILSLFWKIPSDLNCPAGLLFVERKKSEGERKLCELDCKQRGIKLTVFNVSKN